MEKTEHKKRFDSVALNYHSEKYPGRYNCLLFVLDLLHPCDSDIIVDIGCGPGEQLISLSPFIKFGYGIDLSEEMIKVAISRAKNCMNLKFYISSAESLSSEFAKSGITKIYSNYTLHHLPDELKFKSIISCANILKPGGKLILGDLMFSDDPNKYSNLFEYVGYGPESDTPSTVSALQVMFEKSNLKTTVRLLNPILGIIIGEKQ